ncbi:MAG: helix-turn-helix domain-containing protein [Alphaproteobacteria bacterium]|nr:helix-turn-helix domain-containing protein [Alphaproteobacteria bacterium]
MINGRQIRAARALLDWDAEDLAAKTGLSRDTIFNIEKGAVQARGATIEKIVSAFSLCGIEFTDYQGVRLKPTGVTIFDGPEKFDEFYSFLFEHLNKYGGEVCLSVVDENLLSKYRKDPSLHYRRMKELCDSGTVESFRILANKSKFTPTFSTYKWQPGPALSPTAFYAFGDCLALISFVHNPPPYVVVLQSAPLAEAYRQAFNIAWDVAMAPPASVGQL